ncbi:hypothetical protein N7537_002241 [Penicillium hordei]|uniref:DUF7707 domain-containing protein n=1 Tax=Penicillium hordei TaxID=40994 RepID=A0AAD6EIS4_9EURO|nr:uncharacterized protein N7537_002241 [Penicillium hordei]KAJ5617127.1 hypothetical protein N7537_002241 [Penicillium hordei]
MRSSIIFLSALATSVMADNSTDTYTFPAGFNIGLVDSANLNSYCSAQRNTCPQICQQGTKLNSCDPTTLKFSCVCSDGSTPDVTPYSQTVPFFVCQETYVQCIASHPNDADGQRACKKAADCGSKNASAVTTTASTSTMSSTTLALATATESSSSETSSVAPASTTTNAAVALGDLTQYSTGLMAGLMFVAARMVL